MARKGVDAHGWTDKGMDGLCAITPRFAGTVRSIFQPTSHNAYIKRRTLSANTHTCSELEPRHPTPGSQDAEPRVLLPLEVMVHPLELRFKYHFSGDKPTNRLDKV